MSIDKLLVLLFGSGSIAFIYWFFFMTNEVTAQKTNKILVSGGYKPKEILLPAGVETRLILLRTDTNSCLEEIVIPDMGIREFLPLNKEVVVPVTPPKVGIYDIHCGMNMFHATLKAI